MCVYVLEFLRQRRKVFRRKKKGRREERNRFPGVILTSIKFEPFNFAKMNETQIGKFSSW